MTRQAELKAEIAALTEDFDPENFLRIEELRKEYRDILYAEKLQEDPHAALCLLGSEEVAAGIVRMADQLDDNQLREILLGQWTRCEAHRDFRAEFVDYFTRVGYITDVEDDKLDEIMRADTEIPLTIYRGNLGEPEPAGISWTLSIDTAERFGRMAMSPRGVFLGMWREDGIPTVWEATVYVDDVLGYFNDRDEREVVVDPRSLFNVWAIREARP